MFERSGFSVWWDRRIATGESFDRVIERELDAAGCVVVVWSVSSVDSTWVRNEAAEGLERNVLAPILIDHVRPPLAFRSTQAADLADWRAGSDDEALTLLLQDVTDIVSRSSIGEHDTRSSRISAKVAAVTPDPDPRSIAILPFLNRSPDPHDEYFADGLTEELISLLSRGSDLKVAARTSAFTFKGSNANIEEVAERLGVAYVMEGSVRKSGDRLRITAQLVDTQSGFQVWSDSWEKTLDDVFQIQDEIAGAVATALLSSASPLPHPSRKTDVTAYEHYLRGRALLGQSSPQSIEACERAISQAIAIDLDFVDAWSALGKLMTNKAGLKDSNTESAFLFAITAYERALRLDPQNVNAIAGLGWILFYWRWDFEHAGEMIRKAFEIAPHDAEVLNTYATWHGKVGLREQSIDLYRRAIQSDPLAINAHFNLAVTYINGYQIDEAESELRILREIDTQAESAKVVAGWLALRKGLPEDALREFQSIEGSHREWASSFAYFDLQKYDEAENALKSLLELSTTPYYQMASARAYQGKTDEAFEWLDKALLSHDSWLADLRQFFALGNLYQDPRWPKLVSAVGLSRSS